ncbi:MAG TPA: helix-turn-helix transcriptional regulator [Chitinophagales bacterium]|nr:helix-turn-helix transcriptional regulator [Chitinophagales bacterium]
MTEIRDKKLLKRFGSQLRKLRTQRKWTMEELANKADIEISQVHRIESGQVNTTLSTLNALSKALSIPLKTLMDF